MTPRVKICGLTRAEDAALAVALGASAVGFVFWAGSPRVVSPAAARRIAGMLPPLVTRVGVFVNAPAEDVAAIVENVGLDVAQLHGDESLDAYRVTGRRLIRAVSLRDAAALAAAVDLPSDVMPLVDAADTSRRGGTGELADWDRAAELATVRPMILAGGLTAENVSAAVRRVRPWAVDVSSGVEARPGIKSPDRLKAFFAALDSAAAEVE